LTDEICCGHFSSSMSRWSNPPKKQERGRNAWCGSQHFRIGQLLMGSRGSKKGRSCSLGVGLVFLKAKRSWTGILWGSTFWVWILKLLSFQTTTMLFCLQTLSVLLAAFASCLILYHSKWLNLHCFAGLNRRMSHQQKRDLVLRAFCWLLGAKVTRAQAHIQDQLKWFSLAYSLYIDVYCNIFREYKGKKNICHVYVCVYVMLCINIYIVNIRWRLPIAHFEKLQ